METETILSLSEIKKRAVKSFLSLTLRQIVLRAITPITINIILVGLLSPAKLGIFNIATAIVTFFAFFSDIGLGASLIQKKEQIQIGDIKTTFTIQQSLVGFLSLIIIITAPFLGKFYNLDEAGIWLIRILGFCFFLTSFKVIPSVLLERELRFNPLVAVEITETLVFNTLLIFFVFQGFDIWSFSIAILGRGFVGVTLIYILAPVRPRFGIDIKAAKKLLSYGLPFQFNSLLALTKDRLVPLVVARMVGPIGVGYITWSQSLAYMPLELMNMIIRITFPAFSRLQDDKKSLSTAVEKSLFLTATLVYPLLFGMAAILPALVKYVLNQDWNTAVPSFYLFAFSNFWAVISTTFTNTLNAIGEINKTLKLMIMWTVLTWVLTPLLVSFYGFIGVGIASFIISFTSVLTIVLVKKILPIKVIESIYQPVIASVVMGVCTYFFAQSFVNNRITLVVPIILGGGFYLTVMFIWCKNKILQDLRSLKNG